MPGSSCETWSQILMIWAAVSSILLVLYLLCMVELLPVTTWTFEVARYYILWSRCCFLTIMQFSRRQFAIHTARSVQSWFEEHEDALRHLLWLAELPDFNMIEPLASFREQGQKQIPSIISQATRRRGVQYSTRDYSELTWVYSKKDTSCVTGKWWPNSILMCIFHSCFHYFCPSPVHATRLYSLRWLDKLFRNVSLSVCVLFNSLPCLCSIMLLDGFVLLTLFSS